MVKDGGAREVFDLEGTVSGSGGPLATRLTAFSQLIKSLGHVEVAGMSGLT